MIPLALDAKSDANNRFVTRLVKERSNHPQESWCISNSAQESLWIGPKGMFSLGSPAEHICGDIILLSPSAERADRLLRSGSKHNTLLVTEQCDQLCLMCSQPPKKSHDDRFDLLLEACLLAEPDSLIGISGGEPTLYKGQLLDMISTVLAGRPDLRFHVLTNGQHFTPEDIAILRRPEFKKLAWGIPLYSSDPLEHDIIVVKPGAFERLHESFDHLLLSGARIELRTVLLKANQDNLIELARHLCVALPFIEQWSLMGLENIGFARNRWDELYSDLRAQSSQLATAIDYASLFGIEAKIFNVALCQLPKSMHSYAVASISDWKQRFAPQCDNCSARSECSGFFEWHPQVLLKEASPI